MPKYELSNDIVKNILILLDRSEIKGFKEIQAVNMILNALEHPIEDSENVTEEKLNK